MHTGFVAVFVMSPCYILHPSSTGTQLIAINRTLNVDFMDFV